MDGLSYSINFTGNSVQVLQHVNELLGGTMTASNKATKSIGDTWKSLMAFNQITESIDRVKNSLNDVNVPGIALNKSMKDLSAITGVTGSGLTEISDKARESAKAFGTDAAQNVESYKIILSKLNPDIAKSTEGLASMGKSVNILSKSMGGDTVAATGVLTTAMNQYGVSTTNPIEASKVMADMMNIMAAAAQKGSAELPEIGAAIEQAGMQAKLSGVSFSEANAAIQVLDKAGKKGAEGGVALRNVLSVMGEGRFMPKQTKEAIEAAGISVEALGNKTTPLNQRLNLLKPLLNDTALLTKLFGKENSAAGIALVQGAADVESYNTAIQGTTSAVDQANVVMESYEERQKRAKAKIDDIKISFFNATESIQPYMQTTLNAAGEVAKLGGAVNALSTLFINDFTKGIVTAVKGIFTKTVATNTDTVATSANATATVSSSLATTAYTGVMRVFNTVMAANPLGMFLRGLLLVGSALAIGAGLFSAYNSQQNRAAELTADISAKIATEKSELNNLFEQLKRTNPESQKRKELVEELNKRYPYLLKNQNLEKMNEAELETARRGANDELERTITLQAVKEGKEKAAKEISKSEFEISKQLFNAGANENDVAAINNAVRQKTSNIIASGKFKAGIFSGAADSQIDEIAAQIIKENPKLKSKISFNYEGQTTASPALRDFIDNALSNSEDVKTLDKFAASKGVNKTTSTTAATPTTAETETAKTTGKTIAKTVVEEAKKDKTTKGSTASSGSVGTGRSIGSLTINKLIENLVIHTTNLTDTKEKIKQVVTETLLTAVDDYNLSSN